MKLITLMLQLFVLVVSLLVIVGLGWLVLGR